MDITPEIAATAASIRLLIMDCDGVLTDGRLYYSNEGEAMKAFHVHDGQGIVLWREAGFESAIVTARNSRLLELRATELGVGYTIQGSKNKAQIVKDLCDKTGISLSESVFIGDDIADVEAMKSVGLSFAVNNATPEVLDAATLVTNKNGGEGAVREVVEILLSART